MSVGDVGAGTSLAVKLQESANDTDYTDISGATFTTVDDESSDDNSFQSVTTLRRAKRYVRAVATISGSSPDVYVSVTLHGSKTSY